MCRSEIFGDRGVSEYSVVVKRTNTGYTLWVECKEVRFTEIRGRECAVVMSVPQRKCPVARGDADVVLTRPDVAKIVFPGNWELENTIYRVRKLC